MGTTGGIVGVIIYFTFVVTQVSLAIAQVSLAIAQVSLAIINTYLDYAQTWSEMIVELLERVFTSPWTIGLIVVLVGLAMVWNRVGTDKFLTFTFGTRYTYSDDYYYRHNPFHCDCVDCTQFEHFGGKMDLLNHIPALTCFCTRCETCPHCKQCTQTRPCKHPAHVPRTQSQLAVFRRSQKLKFKQKELDFKNQSIAAMEQDIVLRKSKALAKQEVLTKRKQELDSDMLDGL